MSRLFALLVLVAVVAAASGQILYSGLGYSGLGYGAYPAAYGYSSLGYGAYPAYGYGGLAYYKK